MSDGDDYWPFIHLKNIIASYCGPVTLEAHAEKRKQVSKHIIIQGDKV